MDLLNQIKHHIGADYALETVLGVTIAVAVIRAEVTRRADANNQQGFVKACRVFLRQWAPEIFGVTACLAVALALRSYLVRNPSGGILDDHPAWQAILKNWPILVGPDTLLSLQAMLRFVVLLSLVLRAKASSVFSQEVAALFLAAGLSRSAIFTLSSAYMLDGPLGGNLPVFFEIAALPLSLKLSSGSQREAIKATIMTMATCAWVASRHYLILADDKLVDQMWSFVHLLELVSAFTFLFRTFFLGGRFVGEMQKPPLGFAHILMPIQQSLAAYYFVHAFPGNDENTGAGYPYMLLHWGALASFGAYVGAALLYFADHLES